MHWATHLAKGQNDMKKKTSFVRIAAESAGLALALGLLCPAPLYAQSKAPEFEVDPSWPKPLPNLWVTGGIGGLCIDSRDHVFILNRRDLTDNDLDAGHQAPVVIEFDPAGNVVNSFSDPDTTPTTLTAARWIRKIMCGLPARATALCRSIRTTAANSCCKLASRA